MVPAKTGPSRSTPDPAKRKREHGGGHMLNEGLELPCSIKVNMTRRVRDSISFITMTFLIFIGSQFFLFNSVSTGPNLDLSFVWLDLHRHGEAWSIERFRFGGLVFEVALAAAFTWMLARVLPRQTTHGSEVV
jgi:hypothetical protein